MQKAKKKKVSREEVEDNLVKMGGRYDREIFFSLFMEAMEELSDEHVPEQVSCRDTEKEQIQSFIREGLSKQGMQQALYISGVPGIGKTLCVKQVMRRIERELQRKGNRRKHKFIYLNMMQVKNQIDIFKTMLFRLANKVVDSAKKALYQLDDLFMKGKGLDECYYVNKVIVIDEIDYLKNDDQQFLYCLFEWLHSEHSRLTLIAISNTIHFPETLKPKISSRLGQRRITFSPYKSSQIQMIMRERVGRMSIFQDKALEYICKKITQCSCDIRKCLHILREAIDLYLNDPTKKISGKIPLPILIQAHGMVYSDGFTDAYLQLPICYKKVLSCLVVHFRKEHLSIGIQKLKKMCKITYGMESEELKEVLYGLKDLQILSIKFSTKKRFQHNLIEEEKISLKYDSEKIIFAINKDGNREIFISDG